MSQQPPINYGREQRPSLIVPPRGRRRTASLVALVAVFLLCVIAAVAVVWSAREMKLLDW